MHSVLSVVGSLDVCTNMFALWWMVRLEMCVFLVH